MHWIPIHWSLASRRGGWCGYGGPRARPRGVRGDNPSQGAILRPRRGQANDGRTGLLSTPVRRAIITVIAHLLPAETTPAIAHPETRP